MENQLIPQLNLFSQSLSSKLFGAKDKENNPDLMTPSKTRSNLLASVETPQQRGPSGGGTPCVAETPRTRTASTDSCRLLRTAAEATPRPTPAKGENKQRIRHNIPHRLVALCGWHIFIYFFIFFFIFFIIFLFFIFIIFFFFFFFSIQCLSTKRFFCNLY